MTGLAIQKRLTAAFVAVAPVELELQGYTKQVTPSGGERLTATGPIRYITATLIEPGDSGNRYPFTFAQGQDGTLDFQLVAEVDQDVREDDRFSLAGHDYHIIRLLVENGYERRALVSRYH